MSKSVNNPHDKFVRDTFSDPERARVFLKEFLPSNLVNLLAIESLKVLQESYLDKELNEYFSDLILELEVKGKKNKKINLAFLFEHKSAPDKNVLIQVGYYLFAHWFKQTKQRKKLQLVLPLIYYQGKQKWEVPGLVKLFGAYPEKFLAYVPRMEFLFFSLLEIPNHQIETLRSSMLAAALGAQRLRFNPETLVENFNRILRLFPLEEADKNFLDILIVYSFTTTNLSEKNIAEAIKNIPQPIKDQVMTTYDRLIKKGKTEMILALYDDGIGVSQIAKYGKISDEDVLKILKDHGRVE